MTFLPSPEEMSLGWKRAFVVTCDKEAATTSVAIAIVRVGRDDVDDGGMGLAASSVWDSLPLADCGVVSPDDADELVAFWELPPKRRLSLWMTDVEGLSPEEAAEIRRVKPDDVLSEVISSREAVVGPGNVGESLPAEIVDKLRAAVPAVDTTVLYERSVQRWDITPPELDLPGIGDPAERSEAVQAGAPGDFGARTDGIVGPMASAQWPEDLALVAGLLLAGGVIRRPREGAASRSGGDREDMA
ncbi:MAG: hypothetical protein ACR2NJ_03825 [Acidimicrobiales bacterium]